MSSLMNWKIFSKNDQEYIPTGPMLPFDIFRAIFLHLFDDLDLPRQRAAERAKREVQLCWKISDLYARLLVFRSLWVSKYWYTLARDVFYEDLNVETASSLQGDLSWTVNSLAFDNVAPTQACIAP